ncbi:T9SS type B sorting domain-containing protein [Mucilaginibacter limnophilus]|uniref:T9SS type B sorting domain-containing protein n=1 Tax=Mucilaginibacter limnophilus TaxID=1932778 RepID=A0A437MUS4_9SPHI|nr:CshA/CshB family fibrillar adhesin-related protein [Mucilaginibacter limnophilus]RVU01393.1 T9SS type B sorting domain-containing protein [Mucilaginibacter limnophilus]
MTKKYLLKVVLFCCLISIFSKNAWAQYAIGGTAGANLVNSVYWLTWDNTIPSSTMISSPAGFTPQNIIAGTYVWQFSPTVRITAVISDLTVANGTGMQSYTPGSYAGDGLDVLYSGNNQPKPNSRGVPASGIATPYGGTVNFDIDIKVAILINGIWTDVIYPGMIIADAESVDAEGEYIKGNTPNTIAWQLLNKRVQGTNADEHYRLQLSNAGRSFRLFADLAPGNFGVQAVMFARGARHLTDVGMKGSGLTAMAIGFVLPFDLGDDPAGYGTTGHYMDDFEITDYFAGDGTYDVVTYNTTPLTAKATVFIGEDNVDPDGEPAGSATSDDDDNTGNDDESTLDEAALPDVKVNQQGNIVFTVPVTNGKNATAILRAWLDFNGDNVFGPNEEVSVNVPANTNNQNVTLTFPNSMFAGKVKVGPLYARLRLSTTTLIDNPSTPVDERSTSFTADGETEDYRLKDVLGLSISGRVVNDGNGGTDNAISGNPLQAPGGSQLYAYLVDNNNTIVNKATVAADGSYIFDSNNTGTFIVAISTNDVAIGGNLGDIPPALPAGWVPSGEAYGTNNISGTGVETGTPNLRIEVGTPGTSLNVTGVNFGINRAPVATDDAGSTVSADPVTVNIPVNDDDPDGDIAPGTVLLVDPTDNGLKQSVTVSGQGTYTVNPTGTVTFTPAPAFAGKTIPLQYTIKDNLGAESPPALINITVKPTGVADAYTTFVGTPVTSPVKINDGPDAASTTVTVATPPTNGTTSVDAQGRVTYTPNPGYVGTDTYTYVLTTPDGIASDPVTVTVTIGGGSIELTKAATNTGNDAGDIINYTIIARNTGASALSNVTVTDPGADAGSIQPATVASLAAGESATFTATHTLTQADVDAGTYVNQASVTATAPGGQTVTDDASDDPGTPAANDPTVVTITAEPGITLEKTGTFTDNFITYSFVVRNTGNLVLNNVTFTDLNLGINNAQVNNVPPGGLLPGASVPFTYTYTLTQADKDAGSVSNTASVNATDSKGRPVSDDANVTVPVAKSPVAVNDNSRTAINTPVGIPVTTNDNPGGVPLDLTSIEIISPPAHGSLQIGTNGVVTYSPDQGYTGDDVFTYRLKDVFGFYTNVATVNVSITPNGAPSIPNLFTPNGDGVNDVFEIRGLDPSLPNRLTIVNRWGNEVFRQDNYQNTWTGTGLNEGTYYYLLQIKDTSTNTWKNYKGYITLIRATRQ